ncbi:MAG: hypothetical protein KDA66_20780, partial [Planctomycetaceae bacterium]|nr:hypothetical protein [Planctomycetaceae bacterium]
PRFPHSMSWPATERIFKSLNPWQQGMLTQSRDSLFILEKRIATKEHEKSREDNLIGGKWQSGRMPDEYPQALIILKRRARRERRGWGEVLLFSPRPPRSLRFCISPIRCACLSKLLAGRQAGAMPYFSENISPSCS